MGDRANIIVKQDEGEPAVVIYSHWGGTALLNGALDTAIRKAEGRAGDPHYFTALFVESIHENGLLSGIGTSLDDNSYDVFVVNSLTGEQEDSMPEELAKEYLKSFQKGRGAITS